MKMHLFYSLLLILFTSITLNTMAQSKKAISAEFPYKSEYLEVFGSKMHYVDEGSKDGKHVFLLLHGNPTSSYVWRNIIPYLSPLGRVIAPDLIGMGKSDKPDIDYTFADHIKYTEEFIAKMELKNVILIVQDWGSGIGFNYANNHQSNIAGIVFFEALTRPITWKDANMIEKFLFKRFRDPKKGDKMLYKKNFFVEKFLPMAAGRKLSKEEMDVYREPYLKEEDRKPVRVWPTQISINGTPEFSTKIKEDYKKYLENSTMPKLMFYAKPGVVIKKKEAQRLMNTYKNLEAVFLGKGKHFLQESHPHEIGNGIAEWYKKAF